MLSLIGKRLLSQKKNIFKQDLRTFLSNAYNCSETWEQRKRAKIFQKVDYDDLYHQLDRCFLTNQRISILDVDVLLNGISGESYQNELEDVLYKLRLNPETSLLAERTMHAVVKFYIDANKKTDLLHILSNRLTYGVFVDDYAANMLMDSFLKENDATSAAKIAVLVMLQEDFSHPITKTLSLVSCYKYLKSTQVWELPKPEEIDPDEDEIKVRVRCLRTPYCDDHFDLTDPNHLIGKTLYMAGSESPGALGTTSQLIGLILWEKYGAAEQLMKTGIELIESGAEMATAFIRSKPKTAVKEAEEMSEEKTRLINAIKKTVKLQGDVEKLAEEAVVTSVKSNETSDVQKITELYKNWENERAADLEKEIFDSQKRKTLEEITKTRETLAKEEEVIFYFDKEDQWDLKVDNKEAEIRAVELENLSQKKSKKTDVDYVPPEVGQKRA